MLPDNYVLSDADREAATDAVWVGYFGNHIEPDAATWELFDLVNTEARVPVFGRKPTVGGIRSFLHKQWEAMHLDRYRTALASTYSLYRFSPDMSSSGSFLFAKAVKERDSDESEILMRRQQYVAETKKLATF
jgi:hypothetical protein